MTICDRRGEILDHVRRIEHIKRPRGTPVRLRIRESFRRHNIQMFEPHGLQRPCSTADVTGVTGFDKDNSNPFCDGRHA